VQLQLGTSGTGLVVQREREAQVGMAGWETGWRVSSAVYDDQDGKLCGEGLLAKKKHLPLFKGLGERGKGGCDSE